MLRIDLVSHAAGDEGVGEYLSISACLYLSICSSVCPSNIISLFILTQSAGAVEYTDCISLEWMPPHSVSLI